MSKITDRFVLRSLRGLGLLAGFILIVALVSSPQLSAQIHPNHAQGFEPQKAYQIGDLESVNLFNGNLTLTIPIGPRYPVGGEFSYGLTLVYTGNVWEWEEDYLLGPNGYEDYLVAIPRKRSNAGLGWQLSLGRLNPPKTLLTSSASWTYESPDGAIHEFRPNLHADGSQTAGYLYTQDGTYLRLNTATRTVEFPDGTIQRFDTSNRLYQMEDRHGNGFGVNYLSSPTRWVITDDHNRTQTIYFKDASYYGAGSVVDRVVVRTFGGTTGTYTFSYAEQDVVRGFTNVYAINQGLVPRTVHVPLLTGITQPDGSTYSMPVSDYYLGPPSPETSTLSGHIEGMRRPTGGRMEWDWVDYIFPQASASRVSLRDQTSHLSPLNPFRRSAGLGRRRHLKSSGSLLGDWTYTEYLDQEADLRPKQTRTVVVDPLGHQATHYFSVFHNDDDPNTPEPTGYYTEEYGLPFSRKVSDGTTPGRYISTQIHASGTSLVRTTYLRYERDGLSEANPRMASQRTVFHDDGSRHLDVDSSGFDGVGHYRTTATGGNLDGDDRTEFTNYNPGWGATSQPSTGTAWILETYTEQTVTETGATAKTEHCWNQGLLTRTRRFKSGTVRSTTDVVTRYVRDASGNVTAEETFGGDLQSLGTGSLCSLSLPSAAYSLDHTYQYGSLKTSKTSGTTFFSVDLDIDSNTGLAAKSRDTAGLATTLAYDKMGRLTTADLQSGEGADTVYTYGIYSGAQPARVTIQEKDGASVLTEQELQFDGFGRLSLERRKMPDGTWAERSTKTNALGLVYERSEWEADGDPDPSVTQMKQFDPFGRPGKMTLPDGHEILFTYDGVSRRTTKATVGTSVATDGTVTETQANTTEFYDRYGRLEDVREPGYPSAATRTVYEYDVLGNLKRVQMNPGGTPTQERTFAYDGRGFLTSETHPELGTSITYSSFDALGNAGRVQRGGWDLRYTYDAAGRLVKIHEQGTGRDWQEWTYATANGTDPVDASTDWSRGKLRTATRHNWVLIPGTATWFDAAVTEKYTYSGVGGRTKRVATDIAAGGAPHFDYAVAYDALGNVTSRSYPQCTHSFCTEANLTRTVTQSFTRGLLTGVSGFASSITYQPNGMVASVVHTNGVSYYQDRDPSDMLRPSRIRTVGAATDMDTGIFRYDGAGNIVAMGAERYVYDLLSRIDQADLEVTSLLCDDLTLPASDSGTQLYEACRNVVSGASYTVTGTGHVNLRAGSKIVFDGPVSVQPGGYLKAEVDPALANGQEGTLTKSQGYTYDFFGNLLSATTTVEGQSPVPRTFGTNSATNRLTSASYDTSGNVTAWAGNTFDYDPFNMLRHGPGHVYVYGPGNERIWEIDWTAGSAASNWVETWTLRDLDGAPLRQYRDVGGNGTGNWSLHRDYVWRGGALLAAFTPSGLEHFHPDHLGSPRLITDTAGSIVARHRYYPFGEEATDPDQDAEALKFTGHERDFFGTGTTDDLDYKHARYYSPHLGRFFSVDPVLGVQSGPQTWNRYSYVVGNPLVYNDPDGKLPNVVVGAAIGGILGGAGSILAQSIQGGKINWRDVGAAAAGGAVSGALAGATLGLSLVVEGGASAVVTISAVTNAAGGAVTRALDSSTETQAGDPTEVGVDLATGAAGGVLGVLAEKAVAVRLPAVEKQIKASQPAARRGSYGGAQSVLGHTAKAMSIRTQAEVAGMVAGAKTTNVLVPAGRAVAEKEKDEPEKE